MTMEYDLPPALREALEDNKILARRVGALRVRLPMMPPGREASLVATVLSTWDDYVAWADMGAVTTGEAGRMRAILESTLDLAEHLVPGDVR